MKGPIKKKNLLNLKEATFSFNINLIPSNKGCNRPKNEILFGPIRV
jgi:hypothetical protein